MERLLITGGVPLKGEVCVQGAKNSSLPLLAATVLCHGQTVLHNCPELSDVDAACQILSYLGCRVEREGRTVTVDARDVSGGAVPDRLMREMRSSVVFLGAIAARLGHANISFPGGCELGPRPIDLHLFALRKLGLTVREDRGCLDCTVNGRLKGTNITLSFPSVGATENILLAAATAEGTTVITNAAREPEIIDLADFLNRCGAKVKGAGEGVITIEGVERLTPCEHTVIPDRIVAATYLCCGAATGGDVLVKNVTPKHLEPITAKLRRAGVEVEEFDDAVRVRRTGDLLPLKINTMPHPGFPTDMQPLMGVLLSVAKGTSTITESVWDNRFRYVDELRKMGANVQVDGQVAVFEGVDKLTPAPLRALDLRAGAAMVVAGLMADGTSEIEEIGHIERGYENIVEKLQALGADIKKVDRTPAALEQAL